MSNSRPRQFFRTVTVSIRLTALGGSSLINSSQPHMWQRTHLQENPSNQMIQSASPTSHVPVTSPSSLPFTKTFTLKGILKENRPWFSTQNGWEISSTTMHLSIRSWTTTQLRIVSSTSEILMHFGTMARFLTSRTKNNTVIRSIGPFQTSIWRIFELGLIFHRWIIHSSFGSGSSTWTTRSFYRTKQTSNWALQIFSATDFTRVSHTCRTTCSKTCLSTSSTTTWSITRQETARHSFKPHCSCATTKPRPRFATNTGKRSQKNSLKACSWFAPTSSSKAGTVSRTGTTWPCLRLEVSVSMNQQTRTLSVTCCTRGESTSTTCMTVR